MGIPTSRCGEYRTVILPHTLKNERWYCDNFRECPRCMERRAKKEIALVERHLNQHLELNAYLCFLPLVDARNFVRKLRRREQFYRRYPIHENVIVILHFCDEFKDDSLGVDRWDVEHSIEWSVLLRTPEGMAIGGSRSKEKKVRQKGVRAKVSIIHTNAPVTTMEKLYRDAKALANLTPVMTIQQQLDAITEIFLKILKAEGIEVISSVKVFRIIQYQEKDHLEVKDAIKKEEKTPEVLGLQELRPESI